MPLREIIRTIKCQIESRTQEPLSDDSLVMPWLVEHAGCILSRCQKGRDGRTPFERLHGKKPTQDFVRFGEKVLARQITTDPRNSMNPRYADDVFRAREIRRLPEVRVDPIPIPPLPLEGARIQRGLLMKSASLTASGSGQQSQKMSIPDDESGMQVEGRALAKAQRCLQHRQRTSEGEMF